MPAAVLYIVKAILQRWNGRKLHTRKEIAMHRRDILKSAASVAAIGSAGLGRPAIAQGAAKTLRFVPQANLSSLDPIWTTAATATNYGYMVFDTLYGIDD